MVSSDLIGTFILADWQFITPLYPQRLCECILQDIRPGALKDERVD